MTVLEAIQRSSAFLAGKGVESPRLQVELLLAHVLKVPRMNLYLNFDRILAALELDTLRDLVVRRGRREPLQLIIGTTSFCGLELVVSPAVLIPRPETELLAETAWDFLDSLHAEEPSALDFGTGSGCLAVTLAIKCPVSSITALDVSGEALAVAQANAARHGVDSRVRFVLSDGFASLPQDLKFDLVVSNPPYIPSAEIAGLEPEVRDHDPRIALDGGQDGLAFFRLLADEAGKYLKPGGRLMLEIGDGQAEAVKDLLQAQKWIVEGVKADYNGRFRIATARRGAE